jgi:hypothetical protein
MSESSVLKSDPNEIRLVKLRISMESMAMSAVRTRMEKNQPKSLARKTNQIGMSMGEKVDIVGSMIKVHLSDSGILRFF